jgi:hypothetical protein
VVFDSVIVVGSSQARRPFIMVLRLKPGLNASICGDEISIPS